MKLDYLEKQVKQILSHEPSGHDWQHIQRVLNNAKAILASLDQEVDRELVLAACLVHDLIDSKLDSSLRLFDQQVQVLLAQAQATPQQIEAIDSIIHHLSYRDNQAYRHRLSLEGQVVQDADRLDALGAVGIARCFQYGGHKGQLMYGHEASSVQHFYDKLLKLADLMNTAIGRQIAHERTAYMEAFLQQLQAEVEGQA